MNINVFVNRFETEFPDKFRNHPTWWYELRLKMKVKRFYINTYLFDPLRDVDGMISVKKQRLLNLAYRCLPDHEAYLEVGTWRGKSLISAMKNNPPKPTFACDNFSEFKTSKTMHATLADEFKQNITRYGLQNDVHFYDEPFQEIFDPKKLPTPIGFYFYDAAHDHQSQYEGIKMVEPYLAEQALVMVDDWRHANDSNSFARAGTEQAIGESRHQWTQLYELPARFNGDRGLWWNGMGIFSFKRLLIHA